MFYKALAVLTVLALTGCYQRIYTGDIVKAIHMCGSTDQIEYVREYSNGDTTVKCTTQEADVSLDRFIVTKQ